MYKSLVSFLLFTSICTMAYSQGKKVAVVTFYADKRVDLTDFGLDDVADKMRLDEDPNFNMAPLLSDFHTRFFDNYAKSFPFELVPEADVLNTPDYKSFVMDDRPFVYKDMMYTSTTGYKVIDYNWGTKNEKNLLKIFNQYDGIMFVFVSFQMIKGFAINGNGTVKMKAYAHIVLLNKDDKKVFNIHESATSKKTGVVVGGIPILKPEKILPMCESALTELMEDLQKRIPKIIRKTEEKL